MHQQHDVEAPTNGGGNTSEAEAGVATTTKHPRHRPGCSCIVCIQPPSGKGKHKPTCTCNVCMTVKRRFKTLMMRKKKRQSEREAEIAERNHQLASAAPAPAPAPAPATDKEEAEVDSCVPSQSEKKSESEMIGQEENGEEDLNGGLDLNSSPGVEPSMMSLVQEASLPLDTYLRQKGLTLTSLVSQPHHQHTVQSSPENTPHPSPPAAVQEHEGSNDLSDKDHRQDNTS